MTTTTLRSALGLSVFISFVPASAARAADGGATTGLEAAPLVKGPRTVDVILADIARALGSDAAWKAHKNVRTKLEMTFQGMGINGAGEHFATNKDKSVVVTDLPGMGTIREGSNGKVFWSQDPINGTRTLSACEADQARLDSVWNAELRMNELYKSIEIAPSSPPGQECLVLTPNVAPATTNCYDAKTHLQVTQKGTRCTPQGDTPFSSTLKDWREVGGLKMAFTVDTQAGPITFTAKTTDVKYDVPIDEKMFDPPGGAGNAAEKGAAGGKGKAKPKKK
jgi:hypothetical protein